MAHIELRVNLEEIFQQILKDLWILDVIEASDTEENFQLMGRELKQMQGPVRALKNQ